MRKTSGAKLLVLMLALATAAVLGVRAQQIPDAPSATRPPQTGSQFPAGTKPASADPPRSESSSSGTATQGDPSPGAPPSSDIKTMPPRQKPKGTEDDGRDQFTIVKRVNFVTVPVTVKDADGHLVEGLLRKDFAIYEDGAPEPISLFTSDPFPLSAAVVIDQGVSDTALKKVNETLPAITGAFSQFDEVALYTYGDTVHQVTDFAAVSDQLTGALRRSKRRGNTGGAPVVSGPMANGPTVNNHPIDPGTPHVRTPAKESHVLNDAILRAAQDLSRRDRGQGRRKIIFVISDGKEDGSDASYNEVLKVLLSHEVAVYGIGVDTAGIPVYDTLSKIHLPYSGFGNLLPKYVSATAGEYFSEFTKAGIEQAYSKLTEVARNQYTLGYTTRATAASNFRTIEVRVKRPGLRVFAKDGYYPLPPQRASQ